ncbi:hypothetical protein K439DRAFT_452898 [Ramaria rubella]|nr:hypothetical protein K439DRAFT_452898 [Ramaria rubella]
MLVHRGVECLLLFSGQWRGSFHEQPRKADDPPDLIRAIVTMSSGKQFSVKWCATTPITAWCEIKKTTPLRRKETLMAATYMDRFKHHTQTRCSSMHLQQVKMMRACKIGVHYSELTGLGTIRLEIRRLLDDLVVKSSHVSGRYLREDIDMTFIDDPRREMRPYITFEFKILLGQCHTQTQFGRHITVNDKTSLPSSIQEEEGEGEGEGEPPEDHPRKRKKVNHSHQSTTIRNDESGGNALQRTQKCIAKLKAENAALASQIAEKQSMVEYMQLEVG